MRVARRTEFWRAVLGCVILLIVLLFPQGLVGGLKALRRALAGAARMSDASSRSRACTRPSAACRPWRRLLRRLGGRDAGADRPERRGQEHLLQHAERPARARCRHRAPRRPRHRRPAPARHLAAGRRPHLPDHRHLRLAERARERADGALFAMPAACARCCRASARRCGPRPMRCSPRSACSTRPSAPAACWPMAT